MAEAGDFIQAQLADVAGELHDEILDIFSRDKIVGLRLQLFAIFELQRQDQMVLTGKFEVVIIIAIDGLISIIH